VWTRLALFSVLLPEDESLDHSVGKLIMSLLLAHVPGYASEEELYLDPNSASSDCRFLAAQTQPSPAVAVRLVDVIALFAGSETACGLMALLETSLKSSLTDRTVV
jgi:hypothetical protein